MVTMGRMVGLCRMGALGKMVALVPPLLWLAAGLAVTEGSGRTCRPGSTCTSLPGCPVMLRVLSQAKAGDRPALQQLLGSQCGFARLLPMVCCPGGPGGNSSLPRPTVPSSLPTSFGRPPVLRPRPTGPALPASTARPGPVLVTRAPRRTKPTPSDFSHLDEPKCGTRSVINFRVTFGSTAASGQFPWVAALIYTRGGQTLPLCGATLVSRSHLVTAGHCTSSLSGFRLVRARLGQTESSGPVRSPGVEVRVASVVQHPRFCSDPLAVFDIAVVTLARSLRFSDYVRPICLSGGPGPGGGRRAVVAGWGRTQDGGTSPVLRYAALATVARAACQAEYVRAAADGRLGPGAAGLRLLPSQVCARGAGGADSCAGDSGGPLMARGLRGWTLLGLVSYGTDGCDSSLPGVYTRAAAFLPWLQGILRP